MCLYNGGGSDQRIPCADRILSHILALHTQTLFSWDSQAALGEPKIVLSHFMLKEGAICVVQNHIGYEHSREVFKNKVVLQRINSFFIQALLIFFPVPLNFQTATRLTSV